MDAKDTKGISSPQRSQPEIPSGEGADCAAPVFAASHPLAERIKELNCLYGISNLLENHGVSLSWIMQRAVELIPAAWQYPQNACARILLDDKEFTSRNFKATPWRQSTTIVLNDEPVGGVDVFYFQASPENPAGPFLEEEERLLRAIGERLSKVLWLKRSEEALKESEARYRVLTEQVAEGVALVQGGRFRYVNPAFCRMFTVLLAEALIGGLVSAPAAGAADEIARLYSGSAAGDPTTRVQNVHRLTRDGATCWIQVCHSPITLKGQPALLSTFKDITEIKEQQVAAQKMADLLDRENRVLRASLSDRYRLGEILGRSAAMQTVYELILKAAATDASVAIFGESGTGKELVARAIHDHSQRKKARFVAVNCGAIPETLFEREFFGHRKGAFSSAHADSPGYLDMAAGGTLFLDEVGELTLGMQAKLLRAIEGGGYRPVGTTATMLSDFRIISASNTALGDRVVQGEMRDDFFYRIQVIQIQLPPLRERRQDIPLLVEHFLRKMRPPADSVRIAGPIMDALIDYDWPGNVRELRNVLQRYATIGQLEFFAPGQQPSTTPATTTLDLREAVQQLEKSLILRALREAGGNRTKAARLLGISRRALFRKITAP